MLREKECVCVDIHIVSYRGWEIKGNAMKCHYGNYDSMNGT